jgi:hypothetical protein
MSAIAKHRLYFASTPSSMHRQLFAQMLFQNGAGGEKSARALVVIE